MNKAIVVIILSLLCGMKSQGQKSQVDPIRGTGVAYSLGLRVGSNFSFMKLEQSPTSSDSRFKATHGMHLALVYHRPLSRKWAVQPEFVYASQGIRWWWTPEPGREISNRQTHGFFNFPVLLQYVAKKGFVPYTGPQVGFWVFVQDPCSSLRTGHGWWARRI